MENDSNIGQPIPTAVLTSTEIIAPPDPALDNRADEAVAEPLLVAASPNKNILAEMMFAPIAFWASFSTAYFRMFGLMGSSAPSWQRNT